MDNPSREPQQSGEKKPQAGGSQVLLYMLLIATAAGFFALFFNWQNAVVFDYQEFEDLVKQHATADGEQQSYLEINRGTEKNPDLWRYRDLRNIKVGDREITGLVSQEEVAPKDGNRPSGRRSSGTVRFRVNKSTEIDIAIRELFGTYGVKYEWLRPGFFQTYGPMLMITAITVMTSQIKRPMRRMCFVRFSG